MDNLKDTLLLDLCQQILEESSPLEVEWPDKYEVIEKYAEFVELATALAQHIIDQEVQP